MIHMVPIFTSCSRTVPLPATPAAFRPRLWASEAPADSVPSRLASQPLV